MQECTKRNVSTETKCRFHVFQDERFVDLNLYQYGWEQTEPLHSYGPYGTIVQSILHDKNWSHSPLYAFRFSDIKKHPICQTEYCRSIGVLFIQGRTLFLFCL